MRAGVTHLHAGMLQAAHELICQAYRILLVSRGPDHSTTRDLEVRSPRRRPPGGQP